MCHFDANEKWYRTARSRLRFELAGLALAKKAGMSPEEYAGFLWAQGASRWFGKPHALVSEYILKETEAFETLYPEVEFKLGKVEGDEARLTFTRGCLGGWGKERWRTAETLGLAKDEVCLYCREAFRIWADQLGLEAGTEPQQDGGCILTVKLTKEDKSRIPAAENTLF